MNCSGSQDLITGAFTFACDWLALTDAINEFWQLAVILFSLGIAIFLITHLWTRP